LLPTSSLFLRLALRVLRWVFHRRYGYHSSPALLAPRSQAVLAAGTTALQSGANHSILNQRPL